jgi:XTP/dITP diphosphohydrolase
MTLAQKTILIATQNQGKLVELREMLAGSPIEIATLADFPEVPEVVESGSTFAENARLKAAGYAISTSLNALADDSGLEVDALDGRPGVLSAHYGGNGTSFPEKMALLLGELESTGDAKRRARFVCHIAVTDPNGNVVHEAEGICEGVIAHEPRGDSGFGYDPIFIPNGYELTFGELPTSVKQEISHRSRAFRPIIPFLRDFIAD